MGFLFFSLLLLASFLFIASHSLKSFPFPNHLHGSRKGDNVKGIHDVKIYLHRYGYLNNAPAAADDSFDDILEYAIKTYQKYFKLTVNGILDGDTLALMNQPRCGVPDLFKGANMISSGHQNHSHDHLDMVSRYAFYPGRGGPVKWPQYRVKLTYQFIHNYPKHAIPPVARCFFTWTMASNHFTFKQVPENETADIKISFEKRDHGDGYPFDGRGGVVAHAFRPTDGRLHFDGDEFWVDGVYPEAFDMSTVALHELGHILGLAHSQDEKAIMYPYVYPNFHKGLSLDDIQGIRALYNTK